MSNSPTGGMTRNLTYVKQYFKKPMMLVVAVLSLITLISNVLVTSQASKLAQEFVSMIPGYTQEASPSSAGNTIGFLLSGIVTVCLFMVFIFSIASNGKPTIWFSILHVLSVLELIFTALVSLVIVVVEIVFIFATPMFVEYIANSGFGGAENMTEEQIEAVTRSVSSFRITLIIGLVVTLVILGVALYFINAQTAFLKSIEQNCKNPQLKSKGAVQFGNISMVIGIIDLVFIVIFYLMVGNATTSALGELDITLPDMSKFISPYLVYSIASALYIIVRGFFAKGWAAYAKENEDFVYESVGSSTRQSDASPMPTYKSTTRQSQDARQQSQPYLIGEEVDPNKKSSYIPEELQGDFSDQQPAAMYGQPGMDPYGANPYGGGNPYAAPQGAPGGNPYAPQQGGNPYGDPFAGGGADPFAQSPMGGSAPFGGNPYAPQQGGNPYDQGGYNSGMM